MAHDLLLRNVRPMGGGVRGRPGPGRPHRGDRAGARSRRRRGRRGRRRRPAAARPGRGPHPSRQVALGHGLVPQRTSAPPGRQDRQRARLRKPAGHRSGAPVARAGRAIPAHAARRICAPMSTSTPRPGCASRGRDGAPASATRTSATSRSWPSRSRACCGGPAPRSCSTQAHGRGRRAARRARSLRDRPRPRRVSSTRIFGLAAEARGGRLDIHLHEPGEMGAFSLGADHRAHARARHAGQGGGQPRLLPRRA